jgi:hypothetical protein
MKKIFIAILLILSSSLVFSMQQQPAWQEPEGASYEVRDVTHYPSVSYTMIELTRFPDRATITITRKENPTGIIYSGWIEGHPLIYIPAEEAERIYNKLRAKG